MSFVVFFVFIICKIVLINDMIRLNSKKLIINLEGKAKVRELGHSEDKIVLHQGQVRRLWMEEVNRF